MVQGLAASLNRHQQQRCKALPVQARCYDMFSAPPSPPPGMPVDDNGQPGQQQAQQGPAAAQHPAFPAWMRLRILEHMGAGWAWPAAVE